MCEVERGARRAELRKQLLFGHLLTHRWLLHSSQGRKPLEGLEEPSWLSCFQTLETNTSGGGGISDFAGRGGQSSFEGDPSAVPSESGSVSLDLRALLWQWGGVQPVPAVCSSQAGFRACWYPSHLWV